MMECNSSLRTSDQCEQVRYLCRRGGSKNCWTPHEVALVKKHFPDRKKLERLLPQRTWIAIRSRAGILGLRKKQHRWLASDLSRLRKMWIQGESRAAIQAALPNFTWTQIKDQVRTRRFHRPPRPLARSGFTAIDQIKKRARMLNLSMKDVDALAHSGNYFYSAAWTNRSQFNPKHVAKAIAALDGHIEAIWH